MSHCDRCKGENIHITTSTERPFKRGTLVVTDVPVQKCDCDEQILIGDGALVAGYARHLVKMKIIGQVHVSLKDLKQNFTLQDFLPKVTTT
ncbi:YgiT-type zinc finger domain-containing protein [Paenibacillus sp. V4I3]|uniref:YgiT-type zinc finger protein n=1 Tax=unclassified Paenibacillus TaxID=185978 RepID=UPI00278836B3|nr:MULTISPECIES: YgiT-type zinc finger protein [unclassified Paenibacillus]MDQ0878836.1 YgiT-type zinc finger domain-containing protein [Paenibacillus sp. V4I3]MDQ0878890.1 YgiT-type zinc finger domain-containing protein [Paenibacillus sp. V4I3]MDQ0888843.1 YgiT-type zinc finger domain-containing protein [Paenibacillus sp. V4I9]